MVGRTTPHPAHPSTDSSDDADVWTYSDTCGTEKKYEANILDFMSWFCHQEKKYATGTIFTQVKLLQIKPINIHDWLAILCLGIANYDIVVTQANRLLLLYTLVQEKVGELLYANPTATLVRQSRRPNKISHCQ